jgi:hypothetical protein
MDHATHHADALDAFDALHAHLHAAAAACGQHVYCALTRGHRTPVFELGADRKRHTADAYTPISAHATLAWSRALNGARDTSQRLWAALAAHAGTAPLLWDFDPRAHTAPWVRGPLLRVGSDPTGTLAALHLGCIAPMPALGAPTASVEAVRRGLDNALAEPVAPGRHRIALQDIAEGTEAPYIGVAMGAFIDHGAARHLLAGCTTKLAPAWVLCEEAPRPEGLANRHTWDRPKGMGMSRKDGQKAYGTEGLLERYVVIMDNDSPMWLGAQSVEEAHLSLDEVGRLNQRKIWKVLD